MGDKFWQVAHAYQHIDELNDWHDIARVLVRYELFKKHERYVKLAPDLLPCSEEAIAEGCTCTPDDLGLHLKYGGVDFPVSFGCELHSVFAREAISASYTEDLQVQQVLGHRIDSAHIQKAMDWLVETFTGRCGWLGVVRSGDTVLVYVSKGYDAGLERPGERLPHLRRSQDELPQYRYGVKINYHVLPPFTPLTL